MKIAVDMDEILSEFCNSFIKFHNFKYQTSFKKNDFFSFDFSKVLKCSEEEAINRVNLFFESDFFKIIDLVPGSLKGINLLKQKHELHLVTGRQEEIKEETIRWLNQYFPNTFKTINFTNHYSKLYKKTTKAEVCIKLGVKVLIEDSLEYSKGLEEHDIKVILMNVPWNQKEKLPSNFVRVYNWDDILKEINVLLT
jgi:uncharacterized HAD superfamily protein